MSHERLTGRWQMNMAKSMFTPGPPAKVVRYDIEVSGLDLLMKTYRLDAQGNEVNYQYRARFDGQTYPVEAPHADLVSWTPVGPGSYATKIWKGGHLLMTGTLDLSEDGQSIIGRYEGKTAEGKDIQNYLVVEKQESPKYYE